MSDEPHIVETAKSSAEAVAGLVSGFNSNLSQLRDMIRVLGDDCKCHYTAIQDDDNQIHRRAYIRSVFAFMEGVLYRTRIMAAEVGIGLGVLSVAEIVAIDQASYDVNDKGEVISKPVFVKFLNNVKFSFKVLSKSFGSSFELSLGGDGWQKLQKAVKVRDRLMHPKEITDLEVTDTEVEAAKKAFDWFFISHVLCTHQTEKAMQAKAKPFPTPDAVAALDTKIAKLEDELRKRGG